MGSARPGHDAASWRTPQQPTTLLKRTMSQRGPRHSGCLPAVAGRRIKAKRQGRRCSDPLQRADTCCFTRAHVQAIWFLTTSLSERALPLRWPSAAQDLRERLGVRRRGSWRRSARRRVIRRRRGRARRRPRLKEERRTRRQRVTWRRRAWRLVGLPRRRRRLNKRRRTRRRRVICRRRARRRRVGLPRLRTRLEHGRRTRHDRQHGLRRARVGAPGGEAPAVTFTKAIGAAGSGRRCAAAAATRLAPATLPVRRPLIGGPLLVPHLPLLRCPRRGRGGHGARAGVRNGMNDQSHAATGTHRHRSGCCGSRCSVGVPLAARRRSSKLGENGCGSACATTQ